MATVETRDLILQYINSHPGAHLRQIKRDLGLSMGVTQYHLYGLERDNKIASVRNGLYKRFFLSISFGDRQRDILDFLSQETERDLLLYVIQHPNSTQKELSEYARLSPGTINWHMKRLISSGLVGMRHEGQFVKYSVSGEQVEIINLVRNYHPNTLETWVDRFMNVLDAVTQLSTEEEDVAEEPTDIQKNT